MNTLIESAYRRGYYGIENMIDIFSKISDLKYSGYGSDEYLHVVRCSK